MKYILRALCISCVLLIISGDDATDGSTISTTTVTSNTSSGTTSKTPNNTATSQSNNGTKSVQSIFEERHQRLKEQRIVLKELLSKSIDNSPAANELKKYESNIEQALKKKYKKSSEYENAEELKAIENVLSEGKEYIQRRIMDTNKLNEMIRGIDIHLNKQNLNQVDRKLLASVKFLTLKSLENDNTLGMEQMEELGKTVLQLTNNSINDKPLDGDKLIDEIVKRLNEESDEDFYDYLDYFFGK